ncbi:ADP-ribose pyrophosphatase YjhB, NUDIX family [Lentzea waywayandensis]|uniref:ADP-ribose pyrophosphatase YjhB, NUDIX family n=1 Tax=Lentzea waywayandensis TaxID=84724 RepID=A0A1I6EZX0_9PSEU|nr:NUDIX hydrolase [Lentzea waywayandensis]SFR23127.1 ADP-ribose pyrophosphatase YjhB, NUDIX family [Lentzea waywayandensis]
MSPDPVALPKHSVAVVGVVVDEDDRVLVISRRDNGEWQPPGGVLELGETFEDGVRREVFEETGCAVEVQRLTGVYKNLKRDVVALTFRCAATTEPVALTDEARDVRWMTLDEVREKMSPVFAARVLDAFEPEPSVRAHDGVNLL